MRILSLSLDNSIFDRTSALAGRVLKYGKLVDKYTFIAPSRKKENLKLSENIEGHGSGGLNKLSQFINIYNLADKLLNQDKYDVVTVQDQYYLALIGIRLKNKFKAGLEIQVHGFEKYNRMRKLITKYVLPKADSVRCVSQRLKKQLVNQFGVAEEKITVVPIFSELRTINEKLQKKTDENKFIFLTVGRLVPIKNIELQIMAMAEVVKKYARTELWIVGWGREENNLKFEIENFKLGNKIKMIGWQRDLKKYYEQADAFLLTSNYEGWGLAVIEAAAHSLPIIMTNVGCAGEIIKDKESGLVIPVGDRDALIRGMQELIVDRRLREVLGQNALRAIRVLPDLEATHRLYKLSWEKAAQSARA